MLRYISEWISFNSHGIALDLKSYDHTLTYQIPENSDRLICKDRAVIRKETDQRTPLNGWCLNNDNVNRQFQVLRIKQIWQFVSTPAFGRLCLDMYWLIAHVYLLLLIRESLSATTHFRLPFTDFIFASLWGWESSFWWIFY